jgi:drug/metabolite transporter (DMT)-like permease
MNRDRTGRGIGLAAVAAGISGLAVFINGYGVRAVSDATVYTTAKNLVAAVLLLAVVPVLPAVTGRRTPVPPHRPARVTAGVLAVAVIGGSLPFVLFFEGLARASSTHAAFVHKTLVIWVALLAVPLLKERVGWPHMAAIGLLVTGLVLLDGGLGGFRVGGGELLILAATLLWAGETVLARRLLRTVHSGHLALARMGVGVVLLVGWLTVTGRLGDLTGLGGRGWQWAVVTGAVLAAYVATWYTALAHAPAVDVTAVLVPGAVVTGLLSAVVSGAPVTPADVVGMVLLLAGAGLVAVAALMAARRAARTAAARAVEGRSALPAATP